MAMLEVENIHVYYGSIHAVKGVSFQVNEGGREIGRASCRERV